MVTQDNEEIKGPDDLAGKKIGVQNATTGDFVASDIEDAEVERYNNGMEAVMDLKNGNIDAVIIDNLPAQLLAERIRRLRYWMRNPQRMKSTPWRYAKATPSCRKL